MMLTTLAGALAAERNRDIQRSATAARLAALARCCSTQDCCAPLRRAGDAVRSVLTAARDRATRRGAVPVCCTA